MLNNVLPYAYLWPCVALVVFGLCLLFFWMNVLLFLVCFCLYSMIPSEIIDAWVSSSISLIRSKFSFYFENVESNIRNTFIVEGKSPTEKSILIWHPHGLMSVSSVMHNSFRITKDYVPTKIASMDFFHTLPIIRDIARLLHVIPVNYDSIKNTVQQESVSLMLGGVQELLNTSSDTFELTIRNRTGIFRIALETGTQLVPVLTYGENKLFPPISNSYLDFLNNVLYSMFHIAIPYPTLTSLQNWNRLHYEPLEKIRTCIGEPIAVKKIENPTLSDIVELRNLYILKLNELFEKTNSGYTLNII